MFNLRSLRAFVVIAEEGHITRAAERLGLQQPHLTRLLKALEADLDVDLMVRTARGVQPTAAGLVLLEEARAIVARMESAPDLVRRAARGETGRISIGFTSSGALHPFVSAGVRSFRAKFPQVKLTMEEAGTGGLVEGVLKGLIDAAFVRTPIRATSTLTVIKVLDEPMVLAVPAGHAIGLNRSRKASIAALAREPFILYRRPSGPGLYDSIVAACKEAGFSPRVVQEAPRLTATLSLVAAGLGISMVPASMRSLRLKAVRFLEIDGGPVAPIELVMRSDDPNPTLARFRNLIDDMRYGEDRENPKGLRSPQET